MRPSNYFDCGKILVKNVLWYECSISRKKNKTKIDLHSLNHFSVIWQSQKLGLFIFYSTIEDLSIYPSVSFHFHGGNSLPVFFHYFALQIFPTPTHTSHPIHMASNVPSFLHLEKKKTKKKKSIPLDSKGNICNISSPPWELESMVDNEGLWFGLLGFILFGILILEIEVNAAQMLRMCSNH